MLYLNLPLGSSHGWGVCGKYLTRELARLQPTRLITPQLTSDLVGDPLEYAQLLRLALTPADEGRFQRIPTHTLLDGPLLMCITDKQLLPMTPNLRGQPTIGYTFFEDNLFQPAWIDNGRRHFDLVATGSSWCTDVLKANGLTNVATVIQGVDPRIFFPLPDDREFLSDRFLVFTGGKFELRKGQDVVIRAYKVLQDRHPDVMLINSWYNPWPASMGTMSASPLIKINPRTGQYADVINQLLADNGIDISRVITLPPMPNPMMARIYRNTDVGLFPNRCEGGTNLVLMEYMACGKPAIATNTTGHRDVINPDHALVITSQHELTINSPQGPVARWPEPNLEEAIEQLEWAYQNRTGLRTLGENAGREMARCTWRKTAEEFRRLLTAEV